MSGHRLFLALAPISAVILIGVMLMVYRYRHERAAQSLFSFLGAVCVLLIFNTAELIAPTPELTLFFAKCQYFGYGAIPLSWIFFSMNFTGYMSYEDRRLVMYTVLIPFIILILVFTNEMHNLYWRVVEFSEVKQLLTVHPKYGPFFWVNVAYTYILLAGGGFLIIRSFVSGLQIYRAQSIWILIGLVMPFVANALYIFRLIPGLTKDFTPIGFALSGIAFYFGNYFNRLLGINPVARSLIFEVVDTGVVVLDKRKSVIDHNKHADELLGLIDDPVGRFLDTIPELAFLAAQIFPVGRDLLEIRHSIHSRVLSIRIQPYIQGHQVRGWILIMNDLTERIRLQNELETVRGQILQSEKLAAIGQLTAGLAHEINNPLGYLQSDLRSLDMILEKKGCTEDPALGKDIHDILEGAEEAISRISSVVTGLLSFARKGEPGDDFEMYDLKHGIMTTLELARNEYKHIANVETDLMDGPRLRIRRNQINQVILNIITNACEAIRKQNPQDGRSLLQKGYIRIRSWFEADVAICEIENSGPPIPEEIRGRIFEPFFTAGKEGHGTGLGLGISKDIVEKYHNGSLTLASADPVIFRIMLPVVKTTPSE